MNVLALVHRYGPDRCAGAETHLHDLLRALADQGHDVTALLSDQYGSPYVFDGVEVVPTTDVQRQTMRLLPEADVLVSHLENTPRATALGWLNNKPVAVVHHNNFEPARDALLSGRTDLVAVNSAWLAEDLAGWVNRRGAQPVKVVKVRPIPERLDYATTPGDRVTLINCRRYDPNDRSGGVISKGGELFREMALRMPTVGFLAVRGSYGTQQDYSDLPNVETVGPFSAYDMRQHVYARTRVLVVPSSYESWGRVAAEAMASGIPVVASKTPGLQECLGDAGLFVEQAHPEPWVKAVTRALGPRYWGLLSELATQRSWTLESRRAVELERWTYAVESLVSP